MSKQISSIPSSIASAPNTKDYLVTVRKRGETDREFPVEAIDEGDAIRQAYQAAGVAHRTESYHATAIPL